MAYFKKNWPADLHAEVLACAEEVVHQVAHVINLHLLTQDIVQRQIPQLIKETPALQPTVKKRKTGSLKKLIHEVGSDDEGNTPDVTTSTTNFDPSKPRLLDFKRNIDTLEATPLSGMSMMQWWGVCNNTHHHS